MDINRFTEALVSRLTSAGADRDSASREVRTFLGRMSEREAAEIASHADNEELMQRITSALMQGIKPSQPRRTTSAVTSAAASAPSDGDIDDDDDIDDELIDAMLDAESPDQIIEETPPQRQQQQVNPTQRQQHRVQRPVQNAQPRRVEQERMTQRRVQNTQPSQYQQEPVTAPQPQPQPTQQLRPMTQNTGKLPEQKGAPRRTKNEPERRLIHKPDPNADYRKFYIILVCTFPLWGFAAFCVLAAFVIAIGALTAGIVLLIVGLFVGVALGTILALVGIIYGITQLFEYAPIGLYEIGLGVRIGGFVMLFGIIAYNIAVRLLPFLIKQVMVLFSFTVRKCVELYYYVKGRCADL